MGVSFDNLKERLASTPPPSSVKAWWPLQSLRRGLRTSLHLGADRVPWLRWKFVSDDVQLLAINRYLEDLIYQIAVAIEFIQNFLEQLHLHIQVHAFRPIQTNQAGMKHYVGVLPAGAWSGRGTAEIDRVLGD